MEVTKVGARYSRLLAAKTTLEHKLRGLPLWAKTRREKMAEDLETIRSQMSDLEVARNREEMGQMCASILDNGISGERYTIRDIAQLLDRDPEEIGKFIRDYKESA